MLVGMKNVSPIFDLLLLEGVTADGVRHLQISSENISRIEGFPESVSKETLEHFHLQTFQSDHVLAYGRVAFDQVKRSDDPPDFLIGCQGRTIALDCAVLADHQRRISFHLMQSLRKRIIENASGRDFSGVHGCLLSTWFKLDDTTLPPKKSDELIVEALIEEIAACKVDFDGLRALSDEISARGFPQVLPPVIATGQTADGKAGFVANPVIHPSNSRLFSTGLGFEIDLGQPHGITQSSAIENLLRIVNQHDIPEIEHVLVSAGAPDRSGYRYPSEEAIAKFILSEPSVRIRTKHLTKVWIHLWSCREIHEIHLDKSE